MHVDRGYTDPRTAALYDLENTGRDDVEFYLTLAAELKVRAVADVGCGTGVLAVDLAAQGHKVIGVDPAPAMLDVARSRPGGERVRWIDGTAADCATTAVDLVVMTGHVAQVFVDDDDWRRLLTELSRTLKPGGHLRVRQPQPVRDGVDQLDPRNVAAHPATRRERGGPHLGGRHERSTRRRRLRQPHRVLRQRGRRAVEEHAALPYPR